MKKFISLFFILLGLPAIYLFAQVEPILDSYEEGLVNLSEDLSVPEDAYEFTESDLQEFEKKIVSQERDLTQYAKQGQIASCFDYYNFGSIAVNLSQDRASYESGDPIMLRGKIVNNNRYPITNLTIRARFVRDIPNPEYLRSEIITIEDVNIVENVTINANSSLDVNYSHLLPLNAPKGDYQVFFYAYDNERFNQAGLSFTNDIVASRLSFDVVGTIPQHVYLDQTKIVLNNQEHNVMAFMTQHDQNTPITISIPLVNPTSQDEEMEVTYTLYKWDGLRKENIVDTKTETVTVPKEGSVQLAYVAENTNAPVYFLNVKANNATLKKDKSVYNVETQSNIRFLVSGYDFPRVNSFGVDAYPLKKGQEATLFTCYHNGSSQDTLSSINVTTTLYNEKGKEIAKTEYDGVMGSEIKAIINKFTPRSDLINFTVITEIKDNQGNLIDKIEKKYNCQDIDPTKCVTESNYSWIWTALSLFILVLIIIFFQKIKNKINVSTVMFVLFLLVIPVFSAPKESEAAVAYDTGGLNMFCIKKCNDPNTLEYAKEIKGLLGNLYYIVQKQVNLQKDNGTNIETTSTLNINDRVTLNKSATTGDWFFIGGFYDSPPMDDRWYNLARSGSTNNYYFAAMRKPYDKNEVIIRSDNSSIVSCTSSECIAKNPGTTRVTVSFPVNPNVSSVPSNCPNSFPSDNLSSECISYLLRNTYGVVNAKVMLANVVSGALVQEWDTPVLPYTFSNIVYTITVPAEPNTPQITSCSEVTDISSNSATVNWDYTDAENDAQTGYQVQLDTNSAFDSPDFAASSTTSLTSHRFSNLDADTTYYYRVRTYNTANGWGEWTGCSSFYTSDASAYTISYNRNGATSGTAPANQTKLPGQTITISGNSGTLAKNGYRFLGWNTARDGTGRDYSAGAQYTTDANLTLFAKWNTPDRFELKVIVSGRGSVVTFEQAINCGFNGTSNGCSSFFPVNDVVTLFATPAPGSEFVGWGGACSGSSTCRIRMDDPKTVQASFLAANRDPDITNFSFNPAIANSAGQCSLTLNAQNVTVCTVTNRNGTVREVFNASTSNKITNATRLFGVGTYTLACNTLANTTYTHPTQAVCSSNPAVIEN